MMFRAYKTKLFLIYFRGRTIALEEEKKTGNSNRHIKEKGDY